MQHLSRGCGDLCALQRWKEQVCLENQLKCFSRRALQVPELSRVSARGGSRSGRESSRLPADGRVNEQVSTGRQAGRKAGRRLPCVAKRELLCCSLVIYEVKKEDLSHNVVTDTGCPITSCKLSTGRLRPKRGN